MDKVNMVVFNRIQELMRELEENIETKKFNFIVDELRKIYNEYPEYCSKHDLEKIEQHKESNTILLRIRGRKGYVNNDLYTEYYIESSRSNYVNDDYKVIEKTNYKIRKIHDKVSQNSNCIKCRNRRDCIKVNSKHSYNCKEFSSR